jgi:hypothetical protein
MRRHQRPVSQELDFLGVMIAPRDGLEDLDRAEMRHMIFWVVVALVAAMVATAFEAKTGIPFHALSRLSLLAAIAAVWLIAGSHIWSFFCDGWEAAGVVGAANATVSAGAGSSSDGTAAAGNQEPPWAVSGPSSPRQPDPLPIPIVS